MFHTLRISIPRGFRLVLKVFKDGTFELALEPMTLGQAQTLNQTPEPHRTSCGLRNRILEGATRWSVDAAL